MADQWANHLAGAWDAGRRVTYPRGVGRRLFLRLEDHDGRPLATGQLQ